MWRNGLSAGKQQHEALHALFSYTRYQVPLLLGAAHSGPSLHVSPSDASQSAYIAPQLMLLIHLCQGSTFVYQTYFDPYFKKNEADIDAGIVSAQTNTITFAQAKVTAIWEAAWRIATKSGATTASAPATGTPSGQTPSAQQAPPNLFAMGSQLFQTYGPWAMGAIKSSVGSTQTKSTTTGSVNTSNPPLPTPPATKPAPSPGLQQRSPYASRENVATPPVFPEPQHY